MLHALILHSPTKESKTGRVSGHDSGVLRGTNASAAYWVGPTTPIPSTYGLSLLVVGSSLFCILRATVLELLYSGGALYSRSRESSGLNGEESMREPPLIIKIEGVPLRVGWKA